MLGGVAELRQPRWILTVEQGGCIHAKIHTGVGSGDNG